MSQFDLSFIREGKGLDQWLPLAVSSDQTTRRAAGETVYAMLRGVPSIHTDITEADGPWPDLEKRNVEFSQECRRAVEHPRFPKEKFVHQLCRLLIEVHRRQFAQIRSTLAKNKVAMDRDDARLDRILQRCKDRIAKDPTDESKRRMAKRIERVMCAALQSSLDVPSAPIDDALSMPHLAVRTVFEALDVALLQDRESLAEMFAHEASLLNSDAHKVFIRIGPAAAHFLPLLMEQLDRQPDRFYNQLPAALASIGRGNPEVIREMMKRLDSSDENLAHAATSVLQCMGPEMAVACPEIVPLLVEKSYSESIGASCLLALGPLASRHTPAAQRLLDVAKHGSMMERGYAISALRASCPLPEIAVPILIQALEDFKEFDPDWEYDGPKGRIASALESYGPASTPAIGPMLRHILPFPDDDTEAIDRSIVRFLTALGPAAFEALPVLERLSDKYSNSEDPDDLLLAAIRKIRPGESAS